MTHSISWAGGGSYGDVGSWTIAHYNSLAVPLSGFHNTCRNFFPNGDTVSISSFSHGVISNPIILFMVNDTTAHAVNGRFYDQNNGTIYYWDEQNKRNGILGISDIVKIYRP